MNSFAGKFFTMLTVCALAVTIVMAKGKSHTITFNEDTTVNGTTVKKGEYQAVFDEQAGSFTLSNGRHVVITTKAKEEMLEKKAPQTMYDMAQSERGEVLTKVTFAGDNYTIVLDEENGRSGEQ